MLFSPKPRGFYDSFSQWDSDMCIYHLLGLSTFKILHNFLWIIFPIQSCLVLDSFCAYFVINCLVFVNIKPTLAILLHLDDFSFNIIFTNPSARAGYDTGSIFKRGLTGLNSEFSFSWTSCLTKAEEPSLPYYLPIAGGRIIGFIPFPRVLVLCEMQSSRIWTRVAMSMSYNDNHYTTATYN